MSYQDFLKATESPTVSASPSPAPVIHRKPPANYSPLPFSSSPGSVHKTITQYNNLRSPSVSSQGPPPTLTPVTTSMSKRSFSPVATSSPVIRSKISTDAMLTSATSSPGASASAMPSVSATPSSPAPLTNGHTDYPVPPPHAEWHASLKACLALQNDAVSNHNKRPFAALLLGPDRTSTLLSHFSISHVQHAESELARLASIHYGIEYLRRCTLVTTWEPCAMCAGTIYWSGIGRVVYAASEAKLKELTGAGNTENMTMDLPCRTIFGAGQTKVEVVGPVPGWEDKVVEESRQWWKNHKSQTVLGLDGSAISGNASTKSSSIRSNHVVTNPPPEDGVLSRIGEDGEYKADLKIDWMM